MRPKSGPDRLTKAAEPRPRATVWSQRSLIWNFAQRDLKSRFKGTAFGWTWSLLVPLATVITYSIVFSVIFRASPPDFGSGRPGNFTVWLMVGLVPWTFFLIAINIAIPTLLSNGPLLQKIYFPAFAPVLGATVGVLVQTIIEFGILAVILLIFGEVGPTWLLFPVWLCLFVLFVNGIATSLAILNVYARDLAHITAVALQLALLPDADHLPDHAGARGMARHPAADDRPGQSAVRLHREPSRARVRAAAAEPVVLGPDAPVEHRLGVDRDDRLSASRAGHRRVDMTEIAIQADHLSKRFWLHTERRTSIKERLVRGRPPKAREFWALHDASFSVERGSTFGLVGHNGSGKSTTLKVLAGIYRPTSGRVVVRGRVSALLELGAGFHGELTGRENIRLNGAILGMSGRQIDAAMDGIIDFAGIGEFINSPVKVYSSGMFVRLGFAIAVSSTRRS